MPLETATFISDLNAANPAHTDGLSQADSHMRLTKSAVKATFPNFTAAALVSTQAQIDAAVANAALAIQFLVPSGAMLDFGMATAPTGWLACDGQAISRTTYAALFAAIGVTWGAGDGSTTFNVPPLQSYFRRHRDGNANFASSVGTLKVPANFAHTHVAAGTTASTNTDHTHAFSGSGTASVTSAETRIGVATGAADNFTSVAGSGQFDGWTKSSIASSGTASVSGTTGTMNSNTAHTHTFSVTTGGGSVDSAFEARPFSATVLTCIKI